MATSSTCISFLPEDLIENILLRLPVKSLKRFSCVSNAWKLLITDHRFVRAHLSRSSKEDKKNIMIIPCFDRKLSLIPVNEEYPLQIQIWDVIKVWGTCDGLVCVTPKGGSGKGLWNPSTREYKKFSEEIDVNGVLLYTTTYDLGYNSTCRDYQVLKTARWSDNSGSTVQIYSARNHSWTRIQDIPYILYYWNLGGVIVNGKIHWLAVNCSKRNSHRILTYDFDDAKFQEIPLPGFIEDKLGRLDIITVDGKLCVFIYDAATGYKVLEVWVMKIYGSKESWTKVFRAGIVDSRTNVVPLFFTRQGEIVMRFGDSIVLYNPKDSDFSKVKKLFDVIGGPFTEILYTESLVSLGIGSEIVGGTDLWAP